MYGIFITHDAQVLRAPSSDDRALFCKRGWRELTTDEISAAGMTGYEHLVSPLNTVMNDAGSIMFTRPEPPSDEELFAELRSFRDARITATDKYLLADYPVTADDLAVVKVYRQTLRDLPAQEGAPWDGGAELTPWPDLPQALQAPQLPQAPQAPQMPEV